MSSVDRDIVLRLYHEVYTNLQIEASEKIIDSINNVMKEHTDATFTQVIASLKLYLINVIEMMLAAKSGESDEPKTE